MSVTIKRPFDVRKAWEKTERALNKMNASERRQTLIDSGILTKGGNVAKPYAKVFKPISK